MASASRKWNRPNIAQTIREQALAMPSDAERCPEIPRDLERFDLPDLQSLLVRVGRYAWPRRTDDEALAVLSDSLALVQVPSSGDARDIARTAYARVGALGLRALEEPDQGGFQWSTSAELSSLTRRVLESERSEGTVSVDLVRAILRPLRSADREAFRNLVGEVGAAIARLDVAGGQGRAEVTRLAGYQELRALQAFLNGILRASRSGSPSPARELVGAGSAQ